MKIFYGIFSRLLKKQTTAVNVRKENLFLWFLYCSFAFHYEQNMKCKQKSFACSLNAFIEEGIVSFNICRKIQKFNLRKNTHIHVPS